MGQMLGASDLMRRCATGGMTDVLWQSRYAASGDQRALATRNPSRLELKHGRQQLRYAERQ